MDVSLGDRDSRVWLRHWNTGRDVWVPLASEAPAQSWDWPSWPWDWWFWPGCGLSLGSTAALLQTRNGTKRSMLGRTLKQSMEGKIPLIFPGTTYIVQSLPNGSYLRPCLHNGSQWHHQYHAGESRSELAVKYVTLEVFLNLFLHKDIVVHVIKASFGLFLGRH